MTSRPGPSQPEPQCEDGVHRTGVHDSASYRGAMVAARKVGVLAVVVVVSLLSLAASPSALAQAPKQVESGKTIAIERSTHAITGAAAQLGTVAVVEAAGPPRSFTLVYLAPALSADATDTVTYALGGEARSSQVTVSARAEPPTLTSDDLYQQSFRAVFVLFIIAVVLESGLALLFNWRPYIETFDSRGVKSLVAFVFAYFFVETFDLDVTTRLVNLYAGSDFAVNLPGKLVTALVLAGGSGGVNNLLTALGFRSISRQAQVAPKPKPEEAWVAVKLVRDQARGPVLVLIGPPGEDPPTVAGTITGTSKGNRGLRYFVRDRGRFPTAGGYPVAPGSEHVVKLQGVNAAGETITSTETWGPYRFAKGAIVDLAITL